MKKGVHKNINVYTYSQKLFSLKESRSSEAYDIPQPLRGKSCLKLLELPKCEQNVSPTRLGSS